MRLTSWPVSGVVCFAIVFLGCGKPGGPSASTTPAGSSTSAAANLPDQVTGKGWHIPWLRANPKDPHGPLQPVLVADARSGALQNATRNPVVDLYGVRATLYRNGKVAAVMTAPQLTGHEKNRVVVASGGVILKSLPEPSDFVLTADAVTWDTRTSRVVASGHTHLMRKLSGGQVLSTSGGLLTADIGKKPIQIVGTAPGSVGITR